MPAIDISDALLKGIEKGSKFAWNIEAILNSIQCGTVVKKTNSMLETLGRKLKIKQPIE